MAIKKNHMFIKQQCMEPSIPDELLTRNLMVKSAFTHSCGLWSVTHTLTTFIQKLYSLNLHIIFTLLIITGIVWSMCTFYVKIWCNYTCHYASFQTNWAGIMWIIHYSTHYIVESNALHHYATVLLTIIK